GGPMTNVALQVAGVGHGPRWVESVGGDVVDHGGRIGQAPVHGRRVHPGAFGDHRDGYPVATLLCDEFLDGGLDGTRHRSGAAARPSGRAFRAHHLTVMQPGSHSRPPNSRLGEGWAHGELVTVMNLPSALTQCLLR